MKTLSLVFASLAASGIVLAVSHDASACSAPICYGTTASLLPVAPANVPANAAGITVFTARSALGTEEPAIALVKTVGATSEPVAFTVLDVAEGIEVLAPTGGLEIGAKYDVTVGSTCESGGKAAATSITIGATAPKPTTLGSLRVVSTGVRSIVVSSSGPCTDSITAAQAEVEVELAPGAVAWGPLLRYETFVDGAKWNASDNARTELHRGGSWRGIGKDRVYASCGAGPRQGLSAGRHRVVMRAYLAGDESLSLATAAVDVDLTCPSAPPAPTGSGSPGPIGIGEDLPLYEPVPEGGSYSSSSTSGCSAAPGPDGGVGSFATIGLGLAAAAIVVRRKRAKRGV